MNRQEIPIKTKKDLTMNLSILCLRSIQSIEIIQMSLRYCAYQQHRTTKSNLDYYRIESDCQTKKANDANFSRAEYFA